MSAMLKREAQKLSRKDGDESRKIELDISVDLTFLWLKGSGRSTMVERITQPDARQGKAPAHRPAKLLKKTVSG
jgi:hypothetical protein